MVIKKNSPKEALFSECVNFIIEYLEARGLKPKTISGYKSVWSQIVLYAKTNKIKYPKDFTEEDATLFMNQIGFRGVKPRTYNNHVQYARILFKNLKKQKCCTHNPFVSIEKEAVYDIKIKRISEEHLFMILKWCKKNDIQLFRITAFLYYLVCRPCELLSIQNADISYKRKEIIIYSPNSKNKKGKIVRIPDPLGIIMMDMKLENYPPNFYIFSRKGFAPGPEPQIWTHRISERFKKCRVELGLPKDLWIYRTKHTGMSDMLHNPKISQLDVAQQSKVSLQTMNIYVETQQPASDNLVRYAKVLPTEKRLRSLSYVYDIVEKIKELSFEEKKVLKQLIESSKILDEIHPPKIAIED